MNLSRSEYPNCRMNRIHSQVKRASLVFKTIGHATANSISGDWKDGGVQLNSCMVDAPPWKQNNQRQSKTIKNNQKQSKTIKNNQKQSKTIKNNQRQPKTSKNNQKQSRTIKNNQKQSDNIQHQYTTITTRDTQQSNRPLTIGRGVCSQSPAQGTATTIDTFNQIGTHPSAHANRHQNNQILLKTIKNNQFSVKTINTPHTWHLPKTVYL